MSKARSIFVFAVLLAIIGCAGANAQTWTRHEIRSQVLGEQRSIVVRVPAGYESGVGRFPVFYMLDGHEPQLTMAAGILDQQAWAGRSPTMILVGVQNTNRTRDLTPTKTERANSGGGDKFLEFISAEVVSLVERTYRTQPYRVFAGHSLGGLTVMHAATSKPELFNAYIAASPVLHWDKSFVINRTAEFLKTNPKEKKPLFIALGDEPDYAAGFDAMTDLLKRKGSNGFEFEIQHWKDEDHGSIVLRAYLSGLRRVYSDWRPPTTGSADDVEAHYSRLSKKYGYEILPPETLINQIGYLLLRDNKTADAVRVFRRNVELYPNSANTYDSLAEALEKNGSPSKAKENYEKAYKMAEQQGLRELAQSAKANFDRLSTGNR